jgi:hypothetical protein
MSNGDSNKGAANDAPAKPATPAAAAPAKPAAATDKVYEVVHSVTVFRNKKNVTVNAGGEVKASELGEDAQALLAKGIIADPQAPITLATTDLAHDRLTVIAHKLELISRQGSEWVFGGKKFKGQAAFRAGVTLDELELAIVAAAKKAE